MKNYKITFKFTSSETGCDWLPETVNYTDPSHLPALMDGYFYKNEKSAAALVAGWRLLNAEESLFVGYDFDEVPEGYDKKSFYAFLEMLSDRY